MSLEINEPDWQAKHSVSGLKLSRQLGVSQTTAWSLKHKLM
jgi:biotin operon repressor